MFKTKPLSSLKSIFPPIHQPLPLNQRESQKLLNALTSSFRAHLDAEHASIPPPPTVAYLPSSSGPSATSPTSVKDTPARPTDQHLRAILSNPLFKHNEAAPAVAIGSAMEPKEVFERAVAKGLMTIPRAHGFLLRIARDIHQSSALNLSDGMRESGAGLLVIRWLRASGQERKLEFLTDRTFTDTLVRFMVAEGIDEIAWSWLKRVADGDGAEATLNAKGKSVSTLLAALANARSLVVGLDRAYTTILEGDKLIRDQGTPLRSLSMPWISVARMTTQGMWRQQTPGVELFEPFLHAGRVFSSRTQLETAHLDLYHPTKPSVERAVAYLTGDDEQWTKNVRVGWVKRIDSLSLDTLRYLTKAGEMEQAQEILDRIRGYFLSLGRDHPQLAEKFHLQSLRWDLAEDLTSLGSDRITRFDVRKEESGILRLV